jgi:PAS domain S-box-containing protein
LERRTIRQASFWFAVVLIAATSFLAYRGLQQLLTVSASVDRTQDVLLQLEYVSSLLKDAETGQRGFVITGEEPFLDPYREALAQRASALDNLNELASENPALRGGVARLKRLVDEQLSTLAQAIAQRRQGGTAGIDLSLMSRSKELMDAIRIEIANMATDERNLLRAKENNAQRQAKLALLALAAGVLASCGAIIFVFLLITRESHRRQRAENELVRLNADLEQRVAARAAELGHANEALRREGEQRRQAAEAQAEANDRLTAIISAAPFGIYLLDPDGKVAMWNASAARIFGYKGSDIMGRRPPFLEGVNLVPAWEDMAMLALGRPPKGVDLDLTARSGKKVHARMFSATIRPSGKPMEVLHIVEDLTERREIEQQLRQSQKMEVVGQLTGGMAHDFNNLLTVILGNLEVAQEKLPPASEMSEPIESAMKGALRGAELTKRLLAFARKQPLQARTVDLNELLDGTAAMLRRMLGPGITVSVAAAKNLWPAVVDPSQVEDAILNLAVNARDAMPEGGQLLIETGNATLDADYAALNPGVAEGDYVLLAVGDTGTGMAPDVAERAFEPFFTTKKKNKGTGLGLSMIYGFVKQSGGHIKIYSEPGHGTTVRIYLPRSWDGAVAEGGEKPAETQAPLPGGTVLVVEDNVEVRRVAVRMLGDLGYRVTEATGPEEALDILRHRDDIDVLFTDVVMPGKRTGYDLAAEARASHPGLRFLFTSGYSEAFMKHKVPGPGAAHHIGKPYRKQELAAKLRDVLEDVTV